MKFLVIINIEILRSYLSTNHTFETSLEKLTFYYVEVSFQMGFYKPHFSKPYLKNHFYLTESEFFSEVS